MHHVCNYKDNKYIDQHNTIKAREHIAFLSASPNQMRMYLNKNHPRTCIIKFSLHICTTNIIPGQQKHLTVIYHAHAKLHQLVGKLEVVG